MQFENQQIRITRLVCAKGKKIEVSSSATEPTLLIALSPANFKTTGNAKKAQLELGQSHWLAAGQQEQIENVGDAPIELLRFDFKTRLLSKEELQKNKKHEHPKN